MANEIHSTAVIGDGVTLGDNNSIGAYAVLIGPLEIGNNNSIGTGVVLGASPEVRSLFSIEDTELPAQAGLRIGNNNVIREYAQIHQGWKQKTIIGNDCYLMNQVYIAHDCVLGNNVTMASSSLLAGHVTVKDAANLGMGAMVHQGTTIGAGAMIGMGAVVVRPIPMFAKAYGNPARVQGTNTVGMERLSISPPAIETVSKFNQSPGNSELQKALEAEPELAKYLN